eukprot:GILK01014925.1.p1 GENE.GILK01014925.1~~GILK01014925.1.p1  ORF type:complete len:355 (+),score=87.53 GILK01014925.1:113-1066(+)
MPVPVIQEAPTDATNESTLEQAHDDLMYQYSVLCFDTFAAKLSLMITKRTLQAWSNWKLCDVVAQQQQLNNVSRQHSEFSTPKRIGYRVKLNVLREGAFFTKFNFKDGKKNKLLFQLTDDRTLRWALSLKDLASSSHKINLHEAIGINYGTGSNTFAKNKKFSEYEWLCFSIVLPSRTLDLSCIDENQLVTWILGLQALMPNINSYIWTRRTLILTRARLKLQFMCVSRKMTLAQLFIHATQHSANQTQGSEELDRRLSVASFSSRWSFSSMSPPTPSSASTTPRAVNGQLFPTSLSSPTGATTPTAKRKKSFFGRS